MMQYNKASLTETITESSQVIEPEVISSSDKTDYKPKKKRFNLFPLKLFFVLILILITLFLFLRSIEIYNTYTDASKYKASYEKIRIEKIFCEKIKDGEAKREIFNYCDEFEKRFNSIELDTKN